MNMVLETYTPFILMGIGGALFLIVAALVWLVMLERRLRKLFRGRRGIDLETLMQEIQKDLDTLLQKGIQVDTTLENMERRLQQSARHIGLVRFNSYGDTGGDQSFALGVLDERRSGFVISSLHGRDSTRLYAKSIVRGESSYQLSHEERQAIQKALSSDA